MKIYKCLLGFYNDQDRSDAGIQITEVKDDKKIL